MPFWLKACTEGSWKQWRQFSLKSEDRGHIQQIAGPPDGGWFRTIWDRLYCTLQPEQGNRFYFGEANQFQLSWEPQLRFSAKCKHGTQNMI
jgi:hypothetical protein